LKEEQYGCHLNRKIKLPEDDLRTLLEEIDRRIWKDMGVGKIGRILSRTQGNPEPIMQDKNREEILRLSTIDPDAPAQISLSSESEAPADYKG
jgi:hypothetical protein